MRGALSRLLRRFRPFRLIAWVRDAYAEEHIDYRGRFKKCGVGVVISGRARITNCEMISIGDNVRIQDGVMINGEGGLLIGSNVGISYISTIWTVEHNYLGSNAVPFDEKILLKPVRINDNVWIGADVRITSGIEIGEGAVIGIGSVVTKDVPPLGIVLGNPARVIGYRDTDHYERCKADGRFVQFTRRGARSVPLYVQRRPRLYEIVADVVAEGQAELERDKDEENG